MTGRQGGQGGEGLGGQIYAESGIRRTTACCLAAWPICLLSHHLHRAQRASERQETDTLVRLVLTQRPGSTPGHEQSCSLTEPWKQDESVR